MSMTEVMLRNDVVIITKSVEESTTNPTAPVENVDDPSPAAVATTEPHPQIADADKKKKKRSGSFGLFKAALFMMRKRPQKQKEAKKSIARQDSTASNAQWKKLVGSMRPLHLQETDQSPPPSVAPISTSPPENPPSAVEEMISQSPASPAPSSSSGGTMSQYASATSLKSMVDSSDDEEEEEDPDEVFDALCGDEMIDAKAEEFIAQFYKQIKLQNTTTSHHAHHHHVHRGN